MHFKADRYKASRSSTTQSRYTSCSSSAKLLSRIQDHSASITPDSLQALETQTTTLRTATTALLSQTKSLRATLSNLNSTMSTSDLISSVAALEAEKSEITAR